MTEPKKVSPKRWFDKDYDVSKNVPIFEDDYQNWLWEQERRREREAQDKKKPQGAD